MKYNTNKLIIISLFIVFILSMTTIVSAADNTNNTHEITKDTTNTIEQTVETTTTNHKENNQITKIQKDEKNLKTEDNTYTVTVSNSQELKDEIENAKNSRYDNFTINYQKGEFDSDFVQDVYNLTWGNSKGTRTLILNGNGINFVGKNTNQFLTVNEGYNFVLKNVDLSNYYTSGDGAAINCNGTLTIYNSSFENNKAMEGGAIYGTNITIYDSNFKNNKASWGGAITGKNINISNCEFEKNIADASGGAIDSIYLNIKESIFTSNEAYLKGGAISSSYLNISSSSFTNNYLKNTTIKNITRHGGAIYSINTINISDSIFENNFITDYIGYNYHTEKPSSLISDDRPVVTEMHTYGGAIYGLHDINIVNSKFKNNTINGYIKSLYNYLGNGYYKLMAYVSSSHGGAIYSNDTIKINNSSFDDNYAYINGGALYGKNIILDNSSFKSNKIINGTLGNTIYANETIIISNSKINCENDKSIAIYGNSTWSSITIKNSEFNDNNATAISVSYVTIYNSQFNNNDIYGRTTESIYNSTFNTNISYITNTLNPHVGEMITITFSLRDQENYLLKNKDFIVKISSETYNLTTNYDGEASLEYLITSTEDIPIKIIYNGSNDTYNRNSTLETFIHVEEENTNLSLNEINDTYIGNDINISGRLYDEIDNIGLNNQILKVLINNESQQTNTDENGYYNITYTTSTPGINNITVSFEGNEIYPSVTASTTFNVEKIPITIKLNTLDYTFNNDETVTLDIQGELTDYQDNILNNQEIILNINNQNYTIITDNNVFIKQIQLDRGYYPITLTYNGNDIYSNTSLETFINITDKKQSKLTVITKQITDINEELPIIIILQDNEDNPIIQEEVEIEITNEEIITKTTNNIGLINLTYNPKTVGEKNIHVRFNGNNQYNKTENTETITVLNRNDSINDQQDLIETLNSTVNNLTTENKNLNNNLTNLTNENTELNNQISNLTSENQLLNNTIAQLENTTEQQQTIINDLNNTNIELQEENNQLNQTINNLTNQLESLENYEIVNELNNKIEELNATNKNLTNTIQELNNNITNLNNNITNLTNENNQKQSTIDSLTETNNNLKDNVTSLNNTINNLTEENNNLQNQNQELNQTNNQLQNQLETLNNTNKELNNTITSLNNEKNQLTQQINSLNNTIKQQNNTIQNLNDTNNQLNNLLNEQRSINNNLNNLLSQYDNTITTLSQENLENTALINQLTLDKTRLENELLAKDKNITDLTKTINDLYNDKNQLRNQINNLTKESINKDNQIAQLNDLLKQLNTTNNNLNKQITQLTNDLKDKNNTISQLNNTINNLNNEVKKQLQIINNLNNTNKNQASTINNLQNQNKNLNNTVKQQNNTINNLQKDNKNLNNTNKQLQNNITQLNNTIGKLEKELTKNTTIVTVERINGRVGSPIQLKATVKDQQGKVVNEGKVVFKVNGITLKDSESNPLYAQVTNGVATLNYVIPKSWMKNNTTIEVAFSETIHYKSSRNTTKNNTITPGNVKLKIADMPVHENGDKMQFVITATDERGNTINGGTILLKANGVTLKDSQGKQLQATIQNGVAIIDYNITLGARTHDITAVYAYTGYNRIEAKNKLTITKGDIFIRCDPITTNKNSTQIQATIVDKNKNKITYDINVVVKINGATVSNTKPHNGLINITVPTKYKTGTYLLVFTAGETGAYKSDKLTTVIIKE